MERLTNIYPRIGPQNMRVSVRVPVEAEEWLALNEHVVIGKFTHDGYAKTIQHYEKRFKRGAINFTMLKSVHAVASACLNARLGRMHIAYMVTLLPAHDGAKTEVTWCNTLEQALNTVNSYTTCRRWNGNDGFRHAIDGNAGGNIHFHYKDGSTVHVITIDKVLVD